MTNELAHGLNCWFLSRYLRNLTPSTSAVNLGGRVQHLSSHAFKSRFKSPFQFTGLSRSSGHILQLQHGLETLDNNLGHEGCTKSPSENITTDIMFLGTRMIDLRGLYERTLLKLHENCSWAEGLKYRRTHILVRSCDIEIDQVTGHDGGRTHGLASLGFTIDTLEGWINSQHLCDIAFQDFGLVLGHEGSSDIGLVEEKVEHEGECWRSQGKYL